MPGSISEFMLEGGFVIYPLLIIAATVVALIVNGARRLASDRSVDPTLETGIDAILFWGGFGVVVGVVGTLIGIMIAAGFMERMGSPDPALAWGGIRVALTPTVFALLIFAVAALGWFVLRTLYRRRALAAAARAAPTPQGTPEPERAPSS